MVLEEQAKADEKGVQNAATRQVSLVKLAQDEAALREELKKTNLTLGERKSLEDSIIDAEEARGDFTGYMVRQIRNELKAAEEEISKDISAFGLNLATSLNTAMDSGMKAAFSGKDPMKAMSTSMLSSLGNIFSSMGHAMLTQGLIMSGFEPALSDPLTSGPAAIAVGVLLSALGATLGGIMQGDTSSGGGGSYSKNAPQTTNTTYFQTGAGNEAGGVSPQPGMPNVTIIGHNDPQAQRDLGRMMVNMSQRGIAMG